VDGSKSAFMYIWMLGIGDGQDVYYGRTWGDFKKVCKRLQSVLELSPGKRLVVYVHNLGYEFQFMRKHFDWQEVFAVAERKPIKAFCTLGIEFRCSYILSGFSLANTAKNMVNHKVNKMVGDLDYSLTRHHETPLTALEMGYCKNDVDVITAYIQEQMIQYKDISKIPMTNTGRVRAYVRNECYYTSKNHRKSSKSKYYKYRNIMKDLTLDVDTYKQLKRAFMGGFTHANANYSGKLLKDVSSIDFTSSYPTVMVAEQFPMSRFKEVDIPDMDAFDRCRALYAMVFDLKLTGVKCKIKQETYLSESKCITILKPIINNGRVVQAAELTTTITDVDFTIMEKVYSWETISLSNVRIARKNYLPKSIIKSILDLYQDKTILKDVKGSEVEYMLSKGMLNSIYGMSVTDIVKDNSIYTDKWEVEPVNVQDEINNYNESKTRFLYYAWGLWVTAYARRNLWLGIIAVGDDYIYSDTDSLKLFNYDDHLPYIQWYNQQIVDKMRLMCDYYKFDKDLLSPKTQDGKTKMLGVWDFEGKYPKFKTLGAKRYIYEDKGKLKITVAGLSKQNGKDYMFDKCDGDINKVFDMFTDELYIPADNTGKMTHTYIDDEMKFKITDHTGKEATVNPLTGVHLGKCDFTLSIAQQYKDFMSKLSTGYIYKGATYQ